MRRLTASQLGRAARCPGSMTLPHHNETNEATERGTAVHEFLERVQDLGRDAALALVPAAHRPLCEEIPVERLPVHLAAEVAFAFDPRTGRARELGRGLARDYSDAQDGEIVGTADVGGLSPDAVLIVDWKTGWSSVERAAANPQVRFLAMTAARAYGRTRAVVEVIRIRDSGAAWRDRAELDVFELDQVAVEVRELAHRVTADDATFHQGTWCGTCPAFNSCPAKTALLRRLADGSETADLEIMLPLTPDVAGVAYQRYKALRGLLKRVEAALHDYARNEPIPLGEGRYFGELLTEGHEVLDGDVAWDELRKRYDVDTADQAVKRTVTKERLREVLRTRVKKGALAKTERSVLEAIRDRGGASRPVRKELTEYTDAAARMAETRKERA